MIAASRLRALWVTWRKRITNVIVVTVVSLLLWMWAAGRTRETASVEFFLQYAAGDATRMIALPLHPSSVEVTLQGSRRDLDRSIDRLRGKTIVLRSGSSGIPATPGMHAIDNALALSSADAIAATGVAVLDVTPTTTTIELLETETIEVKVAAVLPGVQLSGTATIEPERVQMTLPKSLVPALGAAPQVEAYLPPAQTNLLQPGRRHSVENVPLRAPESLGEQSRLVSIVPDRARVTFTLASRSGSALLKLVPVQIAGPSADLDGFRVSIDPADAFLRDVEVSGPSETIRSIEDGRAKVLAFVHLSADDLAGGLTRKRVSMWMLPSGVTVTSVGGVQDAVPVVRLSIAPRVPR